MARDPNVSGGGMVVLDHLLDATSDARAALSAAFSAFGVGSGASAAFAGILATLRRGQRSTCVGLVGDSTGDDSPTGTGAEEWPRVLLRALVAYFPTYTLQERNWGDTAQGYGPLSTLSNGTGNGGGERGVAFAKTPPGQMGYYGTAATAALDVQVKVNPATWTDGSGPTLAAKWGTSPDRSWLLQYGGTGQLLFSWSSDGSANSGQKASTAAVATGPGFIAGQPLWVRATFNPNNGASGSDLKFYTSPDGTTWTQLGATVTTAGATTLAGGAAPYVVGSFTGSFSNPIAGTVHRVRVFDSIGGQQSLVPPLLDDWELLSTTVSVAYVGAPVLTLLNGSQSGQNVAYFDNATRRAIIHQPHGQQVVLVNTGHNDGSQARRTWLTNYGAMLDNIKTLLPNVPILCMAQNQVGLGGTFAIDQQGQELRHERGAMVMQYAASQAGVYAFDAWPLVTAADTADQMHPSVGAGSGSEKWGLGVFKRLTQPT